MEMFQRKSRLKCERIYIEVKLFQRRIVKIKYTQIVLFIKITIIIICQIFFPINTQKFYQNTLEIYIKITEIILKMKPIILKPKTFLKIKSHQTNLNQFICQI